MTGSNNQCSRTKITKGKELKPRFMSNVGRSRYELQCTLDLWRSVDHHPRRDLAGDVGGELGCLLLGGAFLLIDVRLQATVEVVRAHACVDDRDHNQDNSDDGEEGHRGPSGPIEGGRHRVVHAVQLEAEVGQSGEEEQNDSDHAEGAFSSNEPGTAGQHKDGHGDSNYSEVEFSIMLIRRDNGQELYGETEEEEKIELQQSDENLVRTCQMVN